MCHMEEQMQQQYEESEHKLNELAVLFHEIDVIITKHSCSLEDIKQAVDYLIKQKPVQEPDNSIELCKCGHVGCDGDCDSFIPY